MIVCKLQGGLGNQLFQWATSRNLSIKYSTYIFFETSYFNLNNIGPVSKWNMDISNLVEINQIKSTDLPKVTDNFNYKELPNNCFLDGYWQSERYFKENEVTIRKELEISNFLKEYIFNKYSINSNTVSIHVRRGDYTKLQHIHPTQSIEYYNKAYDIIDDKSINVLIFSDDITWCKENFLFNNMTFIENETNIVDLYIMSLCTHNIIANSSFSWWGAWLNKNKNKKVIAPLKWFNSDLNDSDIIPKEWIRI